MPVAHKKQLISLCDELLAAVEELMLAGLTTASKSTIERIDVSFKEASRVQLLRLGSTLRIANEEIARFNAGAQQFSARRLAFFLGRAWLLASGIRKALDANDDAAFEKLMWTPKNEPLKQLKVVTVGVGKRVVPGAFAAFEFRLRDVDSREPLVWSKVFAMGKGSDLPAEAFLHLPFSQKQKWKPSVLLEKKVVEITSCAVSRQEGASTRLTLGESSEVKGGDAFTDWKSLWTWDRARSKSRLDSHHPTPLDLEIELQEEVFLDDWEAEKGESTDDGYELMPLMSGGLPLSARLDSGASGIPLTGSFKKIASAKKNRPQLFGVVHYESCRFMFQPLSALREDGPEYLTISADKVSQAALVKAMKFT
jgi:hypothetical protein